MAEILLCNQPTPLSMLESQPGFFDDNITEPLNSGAIRHLQHKL